MSSKRGEKKIARYVQPFLERSEQQCPRVMFHGTWKEAYPEDAYPEMQHARSGHLTYKMVSVFQLFRDKL